MVFFLLMARCFSSGIPILCGSLWYIGFLTRFDSFLFVGLLSCRDSLVISVLINFLARWSVYGCLHSHDSFYPLFDRAYFSRWFHFSLWLANFAWCTIFLWLVLFARCSIAFYDSLFFSGLLQYRDSLKTIGLISFRDSLPCNGFLLHSDSLPCVGFLLLCDSFIRLGFISNCDSLEKIGLLLMCDSLTYVWFTLSLWLV
jgi:hypothetical protein